MKKYLGFFDGLRGYGIEMTLAQARGASHQGECDEDVAALAKVPAIKKQLLSFSDDQLKDGLRETGAWEDEEMQDRETNESRALWMAAGDIVENNR